MPEITVDTPNGPFTLTETDGVLTASGWRSGGSPRTPPAGPEWAPPG